MQFRIVTREYITKVYETMWNGKYRNTINTKIEKKGNYYQKIKRFPDERHTQTHGCLIHFDNHICIFQSLESIYMCE